MLKFSGLRADLERVMNNETQLQLKYGEIIKKYEPELNQIPLALDKIKKIFEGEGKHYEDIDLILRRSEDIESILKKGIKPSPVQPGPREVTLTKERGAEWYAKFKESAKRYKLPYLDKKGKRQYREIQPGEFGLMQVTHISGVPAVAHFKNVWYNNYIFLHEDGTIEIPEGSYFPPPELKTELPTEAKGDVYIVKRKGIPMATRHLKEDAIAEVKRMVADRYIITRPEEVWVEYQGKVVFRPEEKVLRENGQAEYTALIRWGKERTKESFEKGDWWNQMLGLNREMTLKYAKIENAKYWKEKRWDMIPDHIKAKLLLIYLPRQEKGQKHPLLEKHQSAIVSIGALTSISEAKDTTEVQKISNDMRKLYIENKLSIEEWEKVKSASSEKIQKIMEER